MPPKQDDDSTVPVSEARRADVPATNGEGAATTPGGPATGEREPGHRRPTTLIVICAVLALAVVGLGIWAFSAQSDADDTQAKLDAATAAAAANQADASQSQAPETTPAPAPTAPPEEPAEPAAPAEPDPATQQQFDELTAAIGATNENLAEIESDLDQAAAAADDAQQAKADASNALERAQADLASFKANLDVRTACLRGVLEALKTAFASGGTEAVVQQLQALSGSCSSSGS